MRSELAAICAVTLLCGIAAAQEPGEIKTEKRVINLRSSKLNYELGTLFVRENRSDPDSRVIGVGFARFPCTGDAPTAPAVIRLPGGPGGSYVRSFRAANDFWFKRAFPELDALLPFCDVVYVDQRGFSQQGDVLQAEIRSPARPKDRPVTLDDLVAKREAFARETVEKFAEGEVDLRGYTVKECASDVDQLREALGYEKMTLMGTSFGSQWSFAIMRMYPKKVARALLSGVEPLDHGFDMPSNVFAAVKRMWGVVDADERFKPYLPEGGMAQAARHVIQRLEQEPIKLEVDAPDGEGQQTVAVLGPLDFPWNEPRQILELYHGRTERWRRIAVTGGFAGGRGQIRLIGPLIDSSLGVTPERRHRLWNDAATRYLSRRNFALYFATADIWPSPDVGDEFRTPVLSEIPVVFAHGDWDIKTPIENAYEIAPFFVNSRLIIAHRGGHGVLQPIAGQLPETWKELVEFVRTGDMNDLPARVTLKPSRQFDPPTFEPPSP